MLKIIKNYFKKIIFIFAMSFILFIIISIKFNIDSKNYINYYIYGSLLIIFMYFLVRIHYTKIIRAIKEDERIRKKFQLNEEKFKTYFKDAPVGVFVLNGSGKLLEINEKALAMFAYSKEELLDNSVFGLLLKNKDHVSTLLNDLHKNNKLCDEEKIITATDKELFVRINAEKINKNRYLIFIEDINSKKIQEEKIKYLSYHDQLTGIYNRRYFEIELERLSDSRQHPISIVIGDLDNLKFVNDNFGHRMGDKYIKKAADIISSTVRTEDIIARIGGDEFALLLPETDRNSAASLCKRICEKCRNFNKETDLPVPLRISLGYAVTDNDKNNLDKIFELADKNMYKDKGRDISIS